MRPPWLLTTSIGLAILSLALLSACNSGTSASDAGDEQPDPDAAATGDVDAGGGEGGEEGDPCERASDCDGELVCELDSGECADEVACTDHDECGSEAHCADDGSCAKSEPNSPCGDGDDCAATDECVGGFCACQGQSFQADVVDINMLIVMDRSGSMANDVGDEFVGADDPNSKWQIALGAVDLLLEQFGAKASFGLSVFPHSDSLACSTCPSEDGCRAGNILVDVGPDAAGDIGSQLDGTDPGCCTPTGKSLDAVVGYEGLAQTDTDNYVLLVADGAENCGGDAVAAAESLRAQDPPVSTFVVGFGSQVNADELSAIAEAGGTARDGETKYYQADDAEALESAFRAVAVEALACSYTLDAAPSDPDALEVYFDGEPVARDPDREDGWDYEAGENRVVFYGPACDALSSGTVGDLTITQPCDVVIDSSPRP